MTLKKRFSIWMLILLLSNVLLAQDQSVRSSLMSPKQFNFDSFPNRPQKVTADLKRFSSLAARLHPEFGYLPFNAPCDSCVELIDKRTATSKYFIQDGSKGTVFYKQQMYNNMHYLDEHKRLRTIDPRLSPNRLNPDLFSAENQIIPTQYKLSTGATSIMYKDFQFQYNENMKMYWSNDPDGERKEIVKTSGLMSAGEDGVLILDQFGEIDTRHIYRVSAIESDFILNSKPKEAESFRYLILEDQFELPEGFQIRFLEGASSPDGWWNGSYMIDDAEGFSRIKIDPLVMYDAGGMAYRGHYRMLREGNRVRWQMLIDASWLNKQEIHFPVTIDPYVSGSGFRGDFSFNTGVGFPYADSMDFTYYLLGSCDYWLTINVPGKCDIVNTLIDLEYINTSSPLCWDPAFDSICLMRHCRDVVTDSCHISSGYLSCNPLAPPFNGTCTTDPNLVPGANALPYPGMLSCIDPQCPDYVLTFLLQASNTKCPGEICGNHCAVQNMWGVTVVGRTLEGYIDADRYSICAGEPVNLFAHPSWGVPPYHFYWMPPINDSAQNQTVYPMVSTFYVCIIYDTCNVDTIDDLYIDVIPSPPADAGDSFTTCNGGVVTIGGSPTTTGGTAIRWTPIPPTSGAWMSSTTAFSPVITIPAGDTGWFAIALETDNGGVCKGHDTAWIYSRPKPHPNILPDSVMLICQEGQTTISCDGDYVLYKWSNGATGDEITVTQAGTYNVSVTDSFGCQGVSNYCVVDEVMGMIFNALPDTTIEEDQAVNIYGSLDLNDSSLVDSFYWSPETFLDCTDCDSPQSIPNIDVVYELHVLGTDGCWYEADVNIKVLHPSDYFIPNAFSPDFDGQNDDFFIIANSPINVLKFVIYDRWGTKLWDKPLPWPGTYKADLCEPGVYVYFTQFVVNNEVQIDAKGSVTLMR